MTAVANTSASILYTNMNPGPGNQIFIPAVTRRDQVSIDGNLVSLNNNTYNGYPFVRLTPAGTAMDHITLGPGAIYTNTTIFSNTETNSTNLTSIYQGMGNVTLDYTETFFLNNNIQAGIVITPTITDNVNFQVTYTYCNPVNLASNILQFTAVKENSQTVDLKWDVTNEEKGRTYYVEVSSAGQNFSLTGISLPSDASNSYASYASTYAIPPTATGKLYFRLRQIDPDSTATWSDIRVINLDGNGNESAFSIYPNPPSDYINVTLPGDPADWQMDIFAADGSLVQRGYYRNSNAVKIVFARRLAAGTYFLRSTNPDNGKHYSGSFQVR